MTEPAVGAVVLEQVGQHGRSRQIVVGSDLNVVRFSALLLQLEDAAKREAADTPETVDTNFYCHVASSWNRCKPLHRTSFSVLAKARKRCNEYKRLNKTGPLPKRREPVPETDGGCAFHRSVVYLFLA